MATGIQTGMNRGSRSGLSRNSQLGKGAPGGGGPLGKLTEIWNNLGKGAKIAITALAVVSILGVGGYFLHSNNNAFVKLYPKKLSEGDIAEISVALTDMRIDHQIDPVDGIKLHPKNRIPAQAKLASLDLPRHTVLTPENVEGGMGKTAAEQEAIRQRLLEGEITLALREMDGINDAMVKIAAPKQTYFKDSDKQTTARVFLNLRQGVELTRGQIHGMINLVAASVPELAAENVTIIDSKGNDLSARVPRDDAGGMVASGTNLEIQAKEEMRLQQKAQQKLDQALPGKTQVSVNLEMDFSKFEEERFTPGGAGDDGVVVEDQQVTRELLNKGDKASEEIGEVVNGGNKPKNASDYVNEKQSTHYMVKQHKTKRVDTGYRTKRITASILADNVSPDELNAIAGFVKNAIGIDESRGDSIQIQNIAFEKQLFPGAAAAVPVFPAAGTQAQSGPAFGAQHMAAAAGMGAVMLLGLIGMFLFKQHRVQENQGTIISSGSSAVTATAIADHFTDKSGKTTAPTSNAGATQVNTTDELEKLVKEEPTKVAEMLKSTWLSQQ